MGQLERQRIRLISLSEDRRGPRLLAGLAVSVETKVIIIIIDLLEENRKIGTRTRTIVCKDGSDFLASVVP